MSAESVAASQTAQVLGGTGASGDKLDSVLIIPTTTSPGNVIILDGATSYTLFDGGATSVASLAPISVPVGQRSETGPWKVTTGANVRVIAFGEFSG